MTDIITGTVEDTHLAIQAEQVTITRSNSDSFEQVAEYTEKRDDSIIAQAGNDNADNWAKLDATATWLEPSADALAYQSMSTSAILAWRQIEDLEEKMLASYGPHLRRRSSTDMSTERFSRKWARYLTERGVPAFDAVADGLIAVIDREEMDERVPTKYRFPKYKDGAWNGSLIIPRRSAFTKEGRQVITGCQVKPGHPDLAVNSEGKPMKVVSPMGEQFNDASVPRRSLWLIEQAGGVNLHRDIVLVLTEGYAEAAGIAGAGVPSFSAAGVNAYFNSGRDADDEIIKDEDGRTAVRVLVPSLRSLIRTWKANGCLRRVQFIVLYDSDAGQKPQVQAAGAETVWAIRREGGRAEFYYAPLQYDEAGELIKGAGAGDYLAKGRTWADLWEKCTPVPMGKSMVKPKVNAAVVKTADEVNWSNADDVYEFALAHRNDGDSFPWDRVGGRERWEIESGTQRALAKHWSETMGVRYLITETNNSFYRYDGTTWSKEDLGKGLVRAANEYLKVGGVLFDCAVGPTRTESEETVRGDDGKPMTDETGKEITRTTVSLAWPSQILSAYEDGSKHRYLTHFMKAEPSLSIDDNGFNVNGEVLVFSNGTWDHAKREWRENRPEDRQTNWMRCAYDPNARHELWEAVLDTWGGRGSELERYMQLVLADGILRRMATDYKVRIIKGEANAAKSFAFDVLTKCFPGTVKTIVKSVLTSDMGSNANQSAWAFLENVGVGWCEEFEDADALHLNSIKELMAGTEHPARKMGQDWTVVRPTWSIFALLNNAPILIGKMDRSIKKRIQLINMPYIYTMDPDPKDKRQKQMDSSIVQRMRHSIDQVRPAAAAWLMEGLHRLIEEAGDNLNERDDLVPEFILRDTEDYLAGNDTYADFIKDSLQIGVWNANDPESLRFQMSNDDLWAAYQNWREREYGKEGSKKNPGPRKRSFLSRFSEHPLLAAHGIKQGRPRQADDSQPRVWVGIREGIRGFTGTGYGWASEGEKEDGLLLRPGAEAVTKMDNRIAQRRSEPNF